MSDAPQADPKKLFVGNLSFDTSKETVESIFSEYGELTDVFMVNDRMTKRFRGFCFVTFAKADQAQAAIDGLNGKEIEGREIVVNVSKPKAPRTGGFNRGGDRRGGNDRNGSNRGYRN